MKIYTETAVLLSAPHHLSLSFALRTPDLLPPGIWIWSDVIAALAQALLLLRRTLLRLSSFSLRLAVALLSALLRVALPFIVTLLTQAGGTVLPSFRGHVLLL